MSYYRLIFSTITCLQIRNAGSSARNQRTVTAISPPQRVQRLAVQPTGNPLAAAVPRHLPGAGTGKRQWHSRFCSASSFRTFQTLAFSIRAPLSNSVVNYSSLFPAARHLCAFSWSFARRYQLASIRQSSGEAAERSAYARIFRSVERSSGMSRFQSGSRRDSKSAVLCMARARSRKTSRTLLRYCRTRRRAAAIRRATLGLCRCV